MPTVASGRDSDDPDADGPRPAAVHLGEEPREPQPLRRRILLIEDDAELREAMQETLTLRGHEVMAAANGLEALQHMRVWRPDLVILDLLMPVMDGWQFRAELKRDPALAGTPVVAISGSDSATAAAVDADVYMTKPVDPRVLLGAIEDVLRRHERKLEPARIAQAERLAALGTLAAGMAHEINNPLTYVLLNLNCALRELELLAGETDRDRVQQVEKLVQSALEGAERIRGITSGIRAFSRAEDVRRVPLDVRSVLDSALRLIMHEIRHRARLTRVYGDVPLVLAGEGRLGQVFLNLLTNAVQAIPEENAGSHEIGLATSTDGHGNAVIEVSDTGCGIPPHLIGRIFEPFFTTKPIGHGTGLGLSISHGIVRSLGGDIEVTSQVGSGSRFRVIIPPLRRPGAQEVEGVAAAGARPVPRRQVLVVDDDRGVCDALRTALSTEHEVVAVQSSREAMALVDGGHSFDLILCDVHMPEVSGIALYQQILAASPDLAARVIFMTAGTFTQQGRDFLAAADRPLLEKPLDLSAVRALLLGASADRSD
ncbi:MAG TPA: response regulator [Kofleriaceae bacterium]|nr:response regulator [Kofleriaceae bacterium]